VPLPGIVAGDGQVAAADLEQRRDEVFRDTAEAKTADAKRRAARNVFHGFVGRFVDLAAGCIAAGSGGAAAPNQADSADLSRRTVVWWP